jgi:hypothetical protein
LSAGAVFQEVMRRLSKLDLPDETRADLLKTLEAARPGPLLLLYEAGAEAGLARETLLCRTSALFVGFATASLADDLIDGDAEYFPDPLRRGPCLQYLLQSLYFAWLAESGVAPQVLQRSSVELAIATGQQHVELRTTQWSASLYRTVAEGIAARQWAAYMCLLWAGTPLEQCAWTVGWNAGIAGHVAEDVRSDDRRFFGMDHADQAEVLAWARTALAALSRFELRSTRGVAVQVERVFADSLGAMKEEGGDGAG